MNQISPKNNIYETGKKFLSQNFYLVVLIVAVAILIIGFFLLIKPKYQAVVGSGDYSREQLQKDEAEGEDYLNQIENLLSVYNNISSDDLIRINSILPNCGSNEDLFGQIDSLVKKNGLLLNSIGIKQEIDQNSDKKNKSATTSQPIAALPELNKIIISINVSGVDYKGFKNLLNSFEANSRIMDIKKISFDPNGFSLNLEIYTYCL